MRGTLVPQPVPLQLAATATAAVAGTSTGDSLASTAASRSDSYLAWNGEVYEVLKRRRVVVSAPFIGAIMSSRFPFLDAAVMQFVAQQPLDCLVDYTLAQGSGDKRILRLVAHRLGLTTASSAVKRAIQFGSRIAHVSDKRRFGSRRKATGEAE